MIIVHSGSRIDGPGRVPPRFPVEREPHVGGRLRALLHLLRPSGVVTAAAGGADLLLAEAALAQDVPLHLVLVGGPARFAEVSVADQGPRWERAYGEVLAHVAADERCSVLEPTLDADEAGFLAANQVLLDHAAALEPEQVLAVAVRPEGGQEPPSVTDNFVQRAQKAGLFVLEIDPRP